jgi:two-component system, OmpR family, response regulator ResD
VANERSLIVLADDDSAIIEMLSAALSDEGYHTVCCFSGKDAFEAVQKDKPQLVILDMQMEKPDAGLDVVQMMRIDPDTATIPVIICSADAVFLREKQHQLKAHGCETLEKPFNLDELLTLIERMLKRSNAASE